MICCDYTLYSKDLIIDCTNLNIINMDDSCVAYAFKDFCPGGAYCSNN